MTHQLQTLNLNSAVTSFFITNNIILLDKISGYATIVEWLKKLKTDGGKRIEIDDSHLKLQLNETSIILRLIKTINPPLTHIKLQCSTNLQSVPLLPNIFQLFSHQAM